MEEALFRLDKEIVTASGKKMSLLAWLRMYADIENREIYIGTDSQQAAGLTKFTTVVVSYEQHKGGTYAFLRYRHRKITSLRERLQMEAWNSIELALLVAAQLPNKRIVIHLDVNADLKYKSAIFASGLVGMVSAQGFKAEIKPKAFCASHLADQLVKKY